MGNVLDCASPLDLPAGDAPGEEAGTTLQNVRLRESMLWLLNRAFYSQVGGAAWSNGTVPSFMTTNAYIARAYAKVILGTTLDIWREGTVGSTNEPLYIVEVGGGSGRLAYLILEVLSRFQDFLPRDAQGRVLLRYVLTDVSEAMLKSWREKPLMKAMCDHAEGLGILDYAVFDAEKDEAIKLAISGTTIEAGAQANPIIFIANYVMDSLSQDAIRLPKEGGLAVANTRLTLSGDVADAVAALRKASGPEDADSLPALSAAGLAKAADSVGAELSMGDVTVAWSYSPVESPAALYPDNPVWASIVEGYRSTLSAGTVLMPVGGLSFLERAQTLTGGNAIVLVGDKGYTQPWEMGVLAEEGGEGDAGVARGDPHLATHGSVSMMVNFDALRAWTAAQGGAWMGTDQLVGFKVAAIMLSSAQGSAASPASGLGAAVPDAPSQVAAALTHTGFHFKHGVARFSPEDFATLQRNVKMEVSNPSLRLLLALLRLAGHDSEVLLKFKAVLIARAAELRKGDPLAADMLACDVPRAQAVYFPLQPEADLHFELGRVCMGLADYASARELFHASNSTAGEHHVSWHNIGLCGWFLGEDTAAVAAFEKCLAMSPEYAEAHKWMGKAKARMASTAVADASEVQVEA